MTRIFETRTISVSIRRSAAAVYAFAAQPENFPKWASGLGSALYKDGDEWIAETPDGPMRVRFAEPNEFGVLDHAVIPEDGAPIYIPLRVIANGQGAEVLVTLFRGSGVSDDKFEDDADWVLRDLQALRELLESSGVA